MEEIETKGCAQLRSAATLQRVFQRKILMRIRSQRYLPDSLTTPRNSLRSPSALTSVYEYPTAALPPLGCGWLSASPLLGPSARCSGTAAP